MQSFLTIALIAVLGFGLLSCKSSSKASASPNVQPLTEGEPAFDLPAQQDFEALDASVTVDNLLMVRVELPPSCKKGNANVAMVWDGTVRKSMPPIATLRFVHEKFAECNAARTQQTYYFDLSPLNKFRGKGGKPVIIALPGFNAKLAYPKQPTN